MADNGNSGSFRPGHKLSRGRPKGSANKANADIKAMIHGALDELGGQRYLVKQAKEHPSVFLALVAKLVPRDLHLDGSVNVRHQLIIRD